jgi:HAD superfamily hydrolase (TIGR01490 family)
VTTPVAFFDFDGTLTRRDSLLPFLRMVAGTPLFVARLVLLSPVLTAYAAKLIRNDVVKEIVLARFLEGMDRDELRQLGRKFASERLTGLLRPAGLERLRWHQAQKHVCVLVSASLDVYLEPWARDMGFDDWITSGLETDIAGRVIGRLSGGNCFGEEKVRRIKEWLTGKEISQCYAYGDSPGDLPMLKMANEGYLLSNQNFVRYR